MSSLENIIHFFQLGDIKIKLDNNGWSLISNTNKDSENNAEKALNRRNRFEPESQVF